MGAVCRVPLGPRPMAGLRGARGMLAFTSRRKEDTEPSYRSESTSVRHFFEDVGCWLPIPGADTEITIELQRDVPKTSGR
jgi:hypothetical protein